MNYLSKKKSYILITLSWIVYTFSYLGRLNYNASLVTIISVFSTDKKTAGLVSSFFFFAYGAGQLVHGLLSKKYNYRVMIVIALVMSSIINILMPLSNSINAMKYLWLINGFSLSILWTSLINALANNLSEDYLPKAMVVMSSTVPAGTILAYGFSSLFVYIEKWYLVFYLSAICMIIAAFCWFIGIGKIGAIEKASLDPPNESIEPIEKKKININMILIINVFIIFIIAISNGFIKDGVTTWTPTILKEGFGLSDSVSIILTLVLPIVSLSSAIIVIRIYQKIKNFNIVKLIFNTITAISLAIILATFLKSIALTLIFFVLISFSMAAVNNVLTSIMPLYLRSYLNSGMIAGIINTFCYVGSTLSVFLLGSIADRGGWKSVFITLAIFSTIVVVLGIIVSVIDRVGKKDIFNKEVNKFYGKKTN